MSARVHENCERVCVRENYVRVGAYLWISLPQQPLATRAQRNRGNNWVLTEVLQGAVGAHEECN